MEKLQKMFFFKSFFLKNHGLSVNINFQAFHHNTFIVFLPFYAFHLILAHLDFLLCLKLIYC